MDIQQVVGNVEKRLLSVRDLVCTCKGLTHGALPMDIDFFTAVVLDEQRRGAPLVIMEGVDGTLTIIDGKRRIKLLKNIIDSITPVIKWKEDDGNERVRLFKDLSTEKREYILNRQIEASIVKNPNSDMSEEEFILRVENSLNAALWVIG